MTFSLKYCVAIYEKAANENHIIYGESPADCVKGMIDIFRMDSSISQELRDKIKDAIGYKDVCSLAEEYYTYSPIHRLPNT